MKRTFLALPINPSRSFLNFFEQIRSELSEESIKWVAPENFHMTLFFFGATSEDMEFRIKRALESIPDNYPVLDTLFDHLGVFPSTHNPRVIWTGVKHPEPFRELYESVSVYLQHHDVPHEKNTRFIPHLTLGRIKWIRNRIILKRLISAYEASSLLETRIDRIQYYQSILAPEGPIYKPLAAYYFKPV